MLPQLSRVRVSHFKGHMARLQATCNSWVQRVKAQLETSEGKEF